MAEKRLRGSGRPLDEEDQGGSEEGRLRATRSFGMSDDEWEARVRRRARFLAQELLWAGKPGDGEEESSKNTPEQAQEGAEATVEAATVSDSPQESLTAAASSRVRKPWESLVIGDLGENLSHIERKNREIEQQRFIVRYHEEHSPHQVDHNRRILDQLIEERDGMEDNEENNMPQDQREKQERIARRLEVLRWVLESSECEDERINVRAAIRGYESGQIAYSHDFTLIYAGHIVDKAEAYHSFCEDRNERLDHYFARYGPGWLWQEPPLAGPEIDALGMKGICLERITVHDRYRIGAYQVNLEFTIRRDKVSRTTLQTTPHSTGKTTEKVQSGDASCQLGTLLDSGATFPIIMQSDLKRLNIDLSEYPAQGAILVSTVGGMSQFRFYEMYVSICSDAGDSLVGAGDDVVWPTEPRSLGGFCPVLVQKDVEGRITFLHRLSGMMPFEACYLSSAPGMAKVWLGEDRRDVLGTNRLPAHLRYDTDKKFIFEYPGEFEALRDEARTPDRVIFLHEFPDRPDILLTDSDTAGGRGKSELVIGQYQPIDGIPGQKKSRKALPRRVIQVEPRKGGIKVARRRNARLWEKDFDKKVGSDEKLQEK